MTISVTVRVEQKHNLGNYEHLIIAAEFGMAADSPEQGLKLVRHLRQRLVAETARSVPADEPAPPVAGPLPVPPAAESLPAPERPPVDESDDPLADDQKAAKRGRKPKAEPLPASERTPADENDDPLADGPLADGPKAAKRGRKPAAEQKDPGAVREDIIRWAAVDVANSGLLSRALSACGYKRLRDVPDDEIHDLANALGRGV